MIWKMILLVTSFLGMLFFFFKLSTFLASSQPCTYTHFLSQVDQGTLFELILAANYLDIKVSNPQEQQYYHR